VTRSLWKVRWWLYLLSGAVTVMVEELYVIGSWNNSPLTAGHWLRSAIADDNGIVHPATLSTIVDWVVVAVLGLIAARACRALAVRMGVASRTSSTDRAARYLGYVIEMAWCAALPVPLLFFSLVSSGFVR
jgi:hypothetical protein